MFRHVTWTSPCRDLLEAHASLVDELLREIYDISCNSADLKASRSDHSGLAIVATGGYGRRELNPYSDIDIAFIPSEDEDPWVRRFAVQAAGSIGPAAREAVPALIEALQDAAYRLSDPTSGEPKIRHYAAWSLGEIGPDAKEAIPALTEALNDEEKWVRSTAEKALAKISMDAPKE